MQLYLFNPDHDEAIAYNKPNYIADKASQALSADLATLMAWLANDGDYVAVPDVAAAVQWAQQPAVAACLPRVQWVSSNPRDNSMATLPLTSHSLRPQPWGWNKQIHHRLQRMGCTSLPTERALQHLRQIAHRHTAAKLLAHLRQQLPELVGEAHLCTTEHEVESAVSVPHTTLLKLPWSGSGRGLRRGFGGLFRPLDGWVRHALAKQGGVMVEPFYDKVSDFAMEFYIDGERHKAHYIGISCFATTGVGGYAGNRLAADEVLLATVERGLPSGLLSAVRDTICTYLPTLLGSYTGPLGIDMMTIRLPHTANQLHLHPCVEINVRHTMGHIACALAPRLAPLSKGHFAIAYARTPEALQQKLRATLGPRMTALHTAQTYAGRIVAGYLPLSPLKDTSLFHAYIMAEHT